jgi:uncharacterized RDD family membrane protein YckC
MDNYDDFHLDIISIYVIFPFYMVPFQRKKAMGIKVVDLQGNRISFPRAFGRFFATYLSGIILGIGYLMALFTGKRQTLHDMIASTLVVKE